MNAPLAAASFEFMRPRRVLKPAARRAAGMSLIEVMISLAIVAMLLVAVGSAFVASSNVIEHNDQFTRAAQAGRMSVNFIMNDVRKTTFDPGSTNTIGAEELNVTVTNNGLLEQRKYWKSGTDLLMTVGSGAAAQTVRLAGNVNYLHFDTNVDKTVVTILVTVKVSNNQVTMAGSAVPRRLMTF